MLLLVRLESLCAGGQRAGSGPSRPWSQSMGKVGVHTSNIDMVLSPSCTTHQRQWRFPGRQGAARTARLGQGR